MMRSARMRWIGLMVMVAGLPGCAAWEGLQVANPKTSFDFGRNGAHYSSSTDNQGEVQSIAYDPVTHAFAVTGLKLGMNASAVREANVGQIQADTQRVFAEGYAVGQAAQGLGAGAANVIGAMTPWKLGSAMMAPDRSIGFGPQGVTYDTRIDPARVQALSQYLQKPTQTPPPGWSWDGAGNTWVPAPLPSTQPSSAESALADRITARILSRMQATTQPVR